MAVFFRQLFTSYLATTGSQEFPHRLEDLFAGGLLVYQYFGAHLLEEHPLLGLQHLGDAQGIVVGVFEIDARIFIAEVFSRSTTASTGLTSASTRNTSC
ncbi:MAG: hypothetical protein HYW07_21515 [Candidatus Latescibacteria bacterium]|nr:hypothetical protein [Candidatus Latescibacterota bacterium]